MVCVRAGVCVCVPRMLRTASSSREPQGGTNRKEGSSWGFDIGSNRGSKGRDSAGGASEEGIKGGRSGSGTDSSQQRRAGGRNWSSREFEMENRKYLDREVKRWVSENLQRKKERCERRSRQEEIGTHTKKEFSFWFEGGWSERSQQRLQRMSGSR